jgi:hypothetical protein
MDFPAEAPPGCLVVLIARSAALADKARRLADDLICRLVGMAAPFDVAVIGYSAEADGALHLASLLPDGRPRVQLLPLAEVASLQLGGRLP